MRKYMNGSGDTSTSSSVGTTCRCSYSCATALGRTEKMQWWHAVELQRLSLSGVLCRECTEEVAAGMADVK